MSGGWGFFILAILLGKRMQTLQATFPLSIYKESGRDGEKELKETLHWLVK